MRRLLILLMTYMFLKGASWASESGNTQETADLRIECVMNVDEFYEHQPVPVVITLKTTNPNIAFANRIDSPTLNKGKFATYQIISPAGETYEEIKNGKKYWCFPLDARMITIDDSGTYELKGGKYKVGIAVPKIIKDPFWGLVRSSAIEELIVPVENKKFKVRSLPKLPDSMEFSGSVGEFSLETVIPPGDIYLNEEAIVYIILRGNGMIAESVLPEYGNAFKNGVRLKSVSETRDEGHDNKGGMLSEITLECTFIPTDRDNAEIGEVKFDYFDASSGKYKSLKSKPVKVKVKSSAAKKERIEI